MRSIVVATAAAFVPPVSSPCAAWKTTWAELPAWLGNVARSMSVAVCDPVPGTLKVSWNAPPAALPIPDSATIAKSQATTTSFRCAAEPRPRRYRNRATTSPRPSSGARYAFPLGARPAAGHAIGHTCQLAKVSIDTVLAIGTSGSYRQANGDP